MRHQQRDVEVATAQTRPPRRNANFPKAPSAAQHYCSPPSFNGKHVMTTFAVAAPPPITQSPRRSTLPTPDTLVRPRPTPPATVRNEDRSTLAARPSIAPAHTEAAPSPNAFLARVDAMGSLILEGRQVTWAIEQGKSAAEIASRYGIRQGSAAYEALEEKVERRRGAIGDGRGAQSAHAQG